MSEYYSDSKKYKLIINCSGSWKSSGSVYDEDKLIATVNRNYGCFPFLFVENHKNGHSYLICGEDYQGQTVIELDTGTIKNVLSDGAEKGFGFCWSDYKFDKESQILSVAGCYWACPYEFRFFDFSDPMNGWPELTGEDFAAYEDRKWPDINGDEITIYQSFEPEDDSDEDIESLEIASRQTFKRDGLNLSLINEWISDKEKEIREERRIKREEFEAWEKDFKENDPLYLEYKNLVKDPILSPEDYQTMGRTYKDWCPGLELDETSWGRRIVKEKNGYTIDLYWAVKTGPIKLTIYKDHNKVEDKFWMEHSVKSLQDAFEYAKELLKS